MENNFNEFDQSLQNQPNKDFGSILDHAWSNYKKVFGYALLFSLVYFIVIALLSSPLQNIAGFDTDVFVKFFENNRGLDPNLMMEKIYDFPGLMVFGYYIQGLQWLLYPLNIGFIYIIHKANIGQKASFADLFAGYKRNLLNILVYGVISSFLVSFGLNFYFIPGVLLAAIFMTGAPVVFFEEKSFIEGFKRSFEVAKNNLGLFIGLVLVGGVIAYSGFILCCIGIVATLPFYDAVIYSSYCAFSGVPQEKE